jgi:hypothetical protein
MKRRYILYNVSEMPLGIRNECIHQTVSGTLTPHVHMVKPGQNRAFRDVMPSIQRTEEKSRLRSSDTPESEVDHPRIERITLLDALGWSGTEASNVRISFRSNHFRCRGLRCRTPQRRERTSPANSF